MIALPLRTRSEIYMIPLSAAHKRNNEEDARTAASADGSVAASADGRHQEHVWVVRGR